MLGLQTSPDGRSLFPFKDHVWVYSCANTIAEKIAQVPRNFYTGNPKNKVLVEEGELVKLFETPNPMMSGFELMVATYVFLGLSGESCWIMERDDPRKLPKEIWCFNPKRFEAVIDRQTGLIAGWKYKKGTKIIPFAPHEVLFQRYFNPYHDYRGLAPLEAARSAIDQDTWASQYNAAFFKNSGIPSIILEAEENLGEEEFTRILSQYKDRHQGVSRSHGIALLEGGVKAKVIGATQRDMDYLEGRKFNREEILGAFKVPKGELGIEEDTGSYAKDKVRRKLFWESTLLPKMGLLEFNVWNQLLSKIEDGNFWMEFDLGSIEALQEDLSEKLEKGSKLFAMGYPPNMINERLDLGMEKVAWGDVGYFPFNLVPAGTPPSPKKEASGRAAIPPPPSRLALVYDRRSAWWLQYNQFQMAMEKKVQSKVKKFFYDQRKAQLQLLFDKMVPRILVRELTVDDILFDLEEANDQIKAIMWPLYLNIGDEAGQSLTAQLGADPATFVLADTPAMAILEDKLIKVVGINDYTRQMLRESLLEGLEAGETVRELQDRIREVFNFTESRSLTIARTETGQAAAPARDAAMGKLGVIKTEWGTAGDGVVRASHVLIAGEQRLRGQPFSNGCLYPCDPSGPAGEVINCRCAAFPVVE